LEHTLQNTKQPYTVLLNGDLTNASMKSDRWDAQVNRVKSLIKIVEETSQGKIILWAGDRDWNKSRKGGQKQFEKLGKEIKSYLHL